MNSIKSLYRRKEYDLSGHIWTILLHMSRNKMALWFEVALNIEKQGLTTSLHEKRNYFPNNPVQIYKYK